ncbi:MAG: ribosome maturation factor RimM [Alphaproteobacteria bacterium]
MAPPDSRVCVGAIMGSHGVRGDVRIKCFTGRPMDVAAFGPVETEDGARRFTIRVIRSVKEGVSASLSGVTDRSAADALKGLRLYVPRAALPELPVEEDEYYLADLIGLAVRWIDGPPVEGRIIAVHNFGAGDLIEVALAEGSGAKQPALLVPFDREVVTQVNVAGGYVCVLLPQEVSEEDKE